MTAGQASIKAALLSYSALLAEQCLLFRDRIRPDRNEKEEIEERLLSENFFREIARKEPSDIRALVIDRIGVFLSHKIHSTEQVLESIERLAGQDFLEEFSEKFELDKDHIGSGTDSQNGNIGTEFDTYLSNHGINDPRIGALLVQFIAERPLSLSALPTPAVGKLTLPLPKKAPELWAKRKNKDEIPPQFATRVYCVWMDAEILTRPDLKRLDPQLFASLDNWLKHNRRKVRPDPLPEGFKLLTLEQSNDSWVNKVAHGQVPFPTDKDELARFAAALNERIRAPRTR